MPNEPPKSRFAEKIKQPAYQAVDKGGFIWVYMGPPEPPPELPSFEWLDVPDAQRNVHKRMQDCNWLQNLEGEVDSSHAPFPARQRRTRRRSSPTTPTPTGSPVFEVLETDFGVAIAARRDAGPDEYYWRITPFMLPCYTIVPRAREANYIWTAAVPIDDMTMFGMTAIWSPDKPVERMPIVDVDDNFRAKQNKANDYLIDRELQKTRELHRAFAASASRTWPSRRTSAGRSPIASREHLGASDLGVIATRRMLLKQLEALAAGAGAEPAAHARRVSPALARAERTRARPAGRT